MLNRRLLMGLPLALLATQARAQGTWAPSRPVMLVVPFAPGGPNDIVARLVAPAMQAALGQNVVVENRPGATGAIAARHVAAQAADGHTLIVAASGTMTINPAVMARPGYDPEKDFAPVSLAMSVPRRAQSSAAIRAAAFTSSGSFSHAGSAAWVSSRALKGPAFSAPTPFDSR